jgi:hypothetical protein
MTTKLTTNTKRGRRRWHIREEHWLKVHGDGTPRFAARNMHKHLKMQSMTTTTRNVPSRFPAWTTR